jgi:hypothetical protein
MLGRLDTEEFAILNGMKFENYYEIKIFGIALKYIDLLMAKNGISAGI